MRTLFRIRLTPWHIALALILIAQAACNPPAPVNEARELQERGEIEASLGVLLDYLESRPDDAEAQYLYGRALSATRRPSEAQFALREAMRSPEWATPAALVLASDALQTGNYFSALQATDEILEREDDNIDALQLHAMAEIASRKGYDRALDDADRMIELDPKHPDAGVLRAIALLGLDRVDEAEEQLNQTAAERGAVAPELQAQYCVSMVRFFIEGERLPEAEEQVDRCRTEHPNNFNVIGIALELFDLQGDSDRSLALLEEVLEEQPRLLAIRSVLASRLQGAGRAEEAEALLVEATGFDPGVEAVPALLDLYRYYESVGRLRESAVTLEKAVALLEPKLDPTILLGLSETWVSIGEFDKARAVAERITDPAHRAFATGHIAIFEDQPELALEQYTLGYKTWPNNAAARFYGAYAAEQLGLFDRAVDEYRYSIRIDPGATDARFRLARLFSDEGAIRLAFETTMVDISKNPLRQDGLLLSLELAGRLGRMDAVRAQIARAAGDPVHYAEAVAAAARGIAVAGGPKPAAKFIEDSQVELENPSSAEALRLLAMLLADSGRANDAAELLQQASTKAPRFATFHEIRGRLLERFGTNPAIARKAYERAVALNPKEARALAGIARFELVDGNTESALALFRLAHEADADDPGIARAFAAALALTDSGLPEAQDVLEAALSEHPTDGRTALALARLLERTDPAGKRAGALAERAVRFGGSAAAFDLLARNLERSGDAEGAAAARSKAIAVREREESPSGDALLNATD